jgi:tRNA U55 pseudouridine synthase TruB
MFVIDNYTVTVSSGTYIRGICDSMGGTAMDIHRISIH